MQRIAAAASSAPRISRTHDRAHFVATGYVVQDGKTLLLSHKKLRCGSRRVGTSTRESCPTTRSCARSRKRRASRP